MTYITCAYQQPIYNENFIDYGLNKEKLLESPEYSFGTFGTSIGLKDKQNYDPNYDPYSRLIVGHDNRVYYYPVKYELNKFVLNRKLYIKKSNRRKRNKRVRRRPKQQPSLRKVKENGRYKKQKDHSVSIQNKLFRNPKIAFISKPMDLKSFVKILKIAQKDKGH